MDPNLEMFSSQQHVWDIDRELEVKQIKIRYK